MTPCSRKQRLPSITKLPVLYASYCMKVQAIGTPSLTDRAITSPQLDLGASGDCLWKVLATFPRTMCRGSCPWSVWYPTNDQCTESSCPRPTQLRTRWDDVRGYLAVVRVSQTRPDSRMPFERQHSKPRPAPAPPSCTNHIGPPHTPRSIGQNCRVY